MLQKQLILLSTLILLPQINGHAVLMDKCASGFDMECASGYRCVGFICKPIGTLDSLEFEFKIRRKLHSVAATNTTPPATPNTETIKTLPSFGSGGSAAASTNLFTKIHWGDTCGQQKDKCDPPLLECYVPSGIGKTKHRCLHPKAELAHGELCKVDDECPNKSKCKNHVCSGNAVSDIGGADKCVHGAPKEENSGKERDACWNGLCMHRYTEKRATGDKQMGKCESTGSWRDE